jgi:hypothetical protein
MWAMPTNYGDDPAPPRYFLIKREKPEVTEAQAESPKQARSQGLDWRQFVLVVMRALVPFPEARDAVKAAFWAAGAEASP